MLYEKMVKNSVAYRAVEKLLRAIAKAYLSSATGRTIRSCGDRTRDIYYHSESRLFFSSIYAAVRDNLTQTTLLWGLITFILWAVLIALKIRHADLTGICLTLFLAATLICASRSGIKKAANILAGSEIVKAFKILKTKI